MARTSSHHLDYQGSAFRSSLNNQETSIRFRCKRGSLLHLWCDQRMHTPTAASLRRHLFSHPTLTICPRPAPPPRGVKHSIFRLETSAMEMAIRYVYSRIIFNLITRPCPLTLTPPPTRVARVAAAAAALVVMVVMVVVDPPFPPPYPPGATPDHTPPSSSLITARRTSVHTIRYDTIRYDTIRCERHQPVSTLSTTSRFPLPPFYPVDAPSASASRRDRDRSFFLLHHDPYLPHATPTHLLLTPIYIYPPLRSAVGPVPSRAAPSAPARATAPTWRRWVTWPASSLA